MTQPTDFALLIPEIREWNQGRGIGPDGWIGCVGTYELAIGYSLIFWPEFVEFEGYAFRSGFSESSLRGFEQQTGGDKVAVEAVMNHIHMVDVHVNVSEYNIEQLRYLVRTLKSIYEVKLRSDFPNRRFVVAFNDKPTLDPIDYELTFWQVA
ncbi:MAG: hypothetical protein K0R27_145 [Xanthobacteraceae bacterium]|jgi:hypothetical protein|nr:hypothetical protein [Xanthobacteraceae bacterium]